MMNRIKKLISFFIAVVLLFCYGCSKELKLLDDYKDYTIVYGLINPNDSISYIRIEKAYLTDGDIFEAAQVADSNQFPYKLDVTLKVGEQIINFDTITIFNKEEGIFYAPKMLVYYAITKDLLNTNDSLLLNIHNPKTKQITSSSTILHDGNKIKFKYPRLNISFEGGYNVTFTSLANTRLYKLNLRFHYMEQYPNDESTRTYKYLDWTFPSYETINSEGGEIVNFPYNGDDFYSFLMTKIPESEELDRYYGQIELSLSSADNTFKTYIEVNKPGTSLVIDRPQFTNIDNGYGLFAARSAYEGFYNMTNNTKNHLRALNGLNFVGGIPEN